jgi:hypothetical protein
VTWEEVERALKKKDTNLLVFEAPQVVSRVEKLGDLFEPVLELKQKLPTTRELLSAVAGGKKEEPERIEIAAQAEEEPAKARKKASKKQAARPRRRKV